jgi:hypothetical protein
LLKQRNTQLGLVIDEATAFPDWDGEPMDRAMAIDGMFSASGDFEVRQAVPSPCRDGAIPPR